MSLTNHLKINVFTVKTYCNKFNKLQLLELLVWLATKQTFFLFAATEQTNKQTSINKTKRFFAFHSTITFGISQYISIVFFFFKASEKYQMRSAFVFGCFCLVLVAMVKSQTCQLNLDCQDHFGPVPAPTENSVMRGKMGPKGSKGEVGLKGEVGPKGPDNSHLVSKNEKSILEVREQVGRTESVARQNSQQISEILEIVSRLDTKFKDILLNNSKNEAFVQNGTARRVVKQEVKSRFLNNSKNEAFVQNKVSRNAKQEVPARGAQGTNETQDTQGELIKIRQN